MTVKSTDVLRSFVQFLLDKDPTLPVNLVMFDAANADADFIVTEAVNIESVGVEVDSSAYAICRMVHKIEMVIASATTSTGMALMDRVMPLLAEGHCKIYEFATDGTRTEVPAAYIQWNEREALQFQQMPSPFYESWLVDFSLRYLV